MSRIAWVLTEVRGVDGSSPGKCRYGGPGPSLQELQTLYWPGEEVCVHAPATERLGIRDREGGDQGRVTLMSPGKQSVSRKRE